MHGGRRPLRRISRHRKPGTPGRYGHAIQQHPHPRPASAGNPAATRRLERARDHVRLRVAPARETRGAQPSTSPPKRSASRDYIKSDIERRAEHRTHCLTTMTSSPTAHQRARFAWANRVRLGRNCLGDRVSQPLRPDVGELRSHRRADAAARHLAPSSRGGTPDKLASLVALPHQRRSWTSRPSGLEKITSGLFAAVESNDGTVARSLRFVCPAITTACLQRLSSARRRTARPRYRHHSSRRVMRSQRCERMRFAGRTVSGPGVSGKPRCARAATRIRSKREPQATDRVDRAFATGQGE